MNKILVTGNGFDLNLGLKTSYQDFLKSEEFKKILEQSSTDGLLSYLSQISGKKNWVNIEDELKKYTEKYSNTDLKILEREFIHLKDALTIYLSRVQKDGYLEMFQGMKPVSLNDLEQDGSLKSENKDDPLSKTIAFDLIRNFSKNPDYPNFDKFISFNYTDVLLKRHYDVEYLYVHGNLKNKNIVFGVEDDCGIDSKFSFLNKSDHHAYGTVNLRDEVENAQEIHFFGCALGETDDTQFKPVFEYLTNRDSRNEIKHVKRKIVFYVYAKEGYRSLFNNLLRHTKNRVGELKVNNQVIFYDVSGEHLKEIDQAWLNSFQDYP